MSLAKINKTLTKVSPTIELVRDRTGYHYFVFDDGQKFETHSVMVCHTNSMSDERWIKEGLEFLADQQNKC